MNAVNPIVAGTELSDHEIMRRLEQASPKMGRRGFLALGGLAGAGLVLGFSMAPKSALAAAAGADQVLNAFVRVTPDGYAVVYSKSPEMGQGIKTGLAMIIAEDLDADWDKVRVEQAPINPKVFGEQFANGSRSIREYSDQCHQVGAAARAMLVAAAAEQWNVQPTECTAANSVVTHTGTGRKLTYAELAAKAATMTPPDLKTVPLKARADWKLLGTRKSGVDNPKLVTGQPLFGIDTVLPNMLYANYTKCPAQGGVPVSANLDDIKKLPGVKDAFLVAGDGDPESVLPGVAIVATSTWAAFQAKKKLVVQWDESKGAKDDSTATEQLALETAKQPVGKDPITVTGDASAAFASAAKVVEATYSVPFLSHANIEPQNTTAWFHDGIVEVWTPSQGCDKAQEMAMKMTGLPYEKVVVHQTRVGTGFGRRGHQDPGMEAVAIAQKVNAPVKLQWSREDDMGHDWYRPAAVNYFKVGLDKAGKVTAWQNHFVTLSHDGKKPVIAGQINKGEFPANMIANVDVTQTMLPWGTKCGTWRAPRSNGLVFQLQGVLHEAALAAGREHLEFLVDFLGSDGGKAWDPKRAVAVLKLAAQKARWGRKLPKGSALGIGYHPGNGGYVAEIAEISVDAKKKVTVHQVWAVADAGPIISLSAAEHQVVGSVLDGFSTMGLKIDFENGRAKQQNFGEYNLLRMPQAFPVDVSFIQSDVHPQGLGEPALPPILAAVGNAIYTATGERIRTLPLSKHGYSI
jgi:isoquinoline 1-oxidoreductase beta subunit